MSYPNEDDWALIHLAEQQFGRRPAQYHREGDELILVWEPDLTPAELAALDELRGFIASRQPMTRDQYSALRAQVQVLRGLRQMGRAAFMALSAAERDRLIYDALVAQTIIDLALLRD